MIMIGSPSLPMVMGQSGSTMAVEMNHGIGSPTSMSKMLLPTELETAMSPCPFLATARLESASGMLVPPARSVSPMIVSGMLAVSPRTVHIQTMTYERAPIMEMHRKKVMGYHLARSSRAQSGMR